MGEIYKITNAINGKCYIGKTKHSSVIRWRDHINGYHPSSLIHKAIEKYGVEHFSFEVIESNISENALNELEIHYIKHFNSKSPNGYNLTNGGDGGKGFIATDEWRKKLSLSRKGKSWSESRRLAGQTKLIGNNNAGKMVAMIKDNNIIKVFSSTTVASAETGIYRTNISRSCNNPKLKAGGYHWQYVIREE